MVSLGELRAGLFRWRDATCRELDESTGYVLPRVLLARLSQQMPTTLAALKQAAGAGNSVLMSRSKQACTKPSPAPNSPLLEHECSQQSGNTSRWLRQVSLLVDPARCQCWTFLDSSKPASVCTCRIFDIPDVNVLINFG